MLKELQQGLSLRRLKFRYQTETGEKEVFVSTGAGRSNLTSEKGIALRSKDNFCLELVPARDCYLYIYQIDSRGRFYWYFPNGEVSPQGNPVRAGQTYRLPGTKGSCKGKGMWLGLDENPGTEEVFLIASRWQASDLEEVLGKLKGVQKTPLKGTPHESLLEELERRISARERNQRLAGTGAYLSKVVTFENESSERLAALFRGRDGAEMVQVPTGELRMGNPE